MLDFLDADYTFVNERLARHYGIAGVVGRRLPPGLAGRHAAGRRPDPGEHPGGRRPTRPGPRRSSGASGSWRTCWARRPRRRLRAWRRSRKVGRRIVGHAPRADGAAPERPDLRARATAGWTRSGFALENFDADRRPGGRTRTGRRSMPTGRLPAGREFRGRPRAAGRAPVASGCVRPLPRREDAHLCAWAAASSRADRRAVDRIVARLSPDGYRFSALVLAVVESVPFREPEPTGGQP